MDPHEEKCLLFLCQAVDTFGFETSSFVTVLLDYKMFENVLHAIFGKLDRLRSNFKCVIQLRN